ncbi:hypothetical protein U1Q18_033376 [Sarracenia purpurea var. burkii]
MLGDKENVDDGKDLIAKSLDFLKYLPYKSFLAIPSSRLASTLKVIMKTMKTGDSRALPLLKKLEGRTSGTDIDGEGFSEEASREGDREGFFEDASDETKMVLLIIWWS